MIPVEKLNRPPQAATEERNMQKAISIEIFFTIVPFP